jgi:hypothetical protein
MPSQVTERQAERKLLAGCGRGPGPHYAQPDAPTGRCVVPGCRDGIDPSRLMCRRDWYAIQDVADAGGRVRPSAIGGAAEVPAFGTETGVLISPGPWLIGAAAGAVAVHGRGHMGREHLCQERWYVNRPDRAVLRRSRCHWMLPGLATASRAATSRGRLTGAAWKARPSSSLTFRQARFAMSGLCQPFEPFARPH